MCYVNGLYTFFFLLLYYRVVQLATIIYKGSFLDDAVWWWQTRLNWNYLYKDYDKGFIAKYNVFLFWKIENLLLFGNRWPVQEKNQSG